MEPAPWIKDYVVDMEELYTELRLEQIDKKLFSEERIQLENYKELFPLYDSQNMMKFFDIMYYLPGIKILIKGDPGMGKSSLVKKIARDWAKRHFVQVSIVFFVYLKLIKPGDAIENAILQQTYPLAERGYTKAKMTKILQYFGKDCLLILDGLDECAYGQNDEVYKIVRGLKFVNCNIMLTSRPHSTGEIEKYFETIVSVEGFTPNEARKFAIRIVPNEQKVEDIINFNPAGERAKCSVHNVPILLSFLCLLVREENIDLSNTKISMGEIYFRMVQCLYKKFTLRKKIRFEKEILVTVLKSLGKLALETLLSGDPLLERFKIIEQIGEEVFEYGLLIGQDGFSFTRDMTGDVFVTFPHRSLQEFLGAFYFVLSLGKEQAVKDVDKVFYEFWRNPLFLEFCLWFLAESNGFLSSSESSTACQMLGSYVRKEIDAVKVDFQKLERNNPALSLALGDNRNEIALEILEAALEECSRMKHVVIKPYHPVDRILGSISPSIFQRLNSIEMSSFKEKLISHFKGEESEIIPKNHSFNLTVKCDLSTESMDALNVVLEATKDWNRPVYLHVSRSMCRTSSKDFPMYNAYPQLVSLFLSKCHLDSGHVSHLAEASGQGRLPKLSILNISGNPRIGGNLSALLSHC